jgi:hypothetical protein
LWKAAEEAGRWAGIFENLNNLQFFQILEIKEPSALFFAFLKFSNSLK